MKTLATGLQAHLDTGATTLCWCWKITRTDGVKMGFTDHDEPVIYDGVTYEAMTGFTATEVRSSLGLSVDNLDVEGALSSDKITEADISIGLYDGAEIEVTRVNWKNVAQRMVSRTGNIGEITRGETSFMAEVRGLAHRLQESQGRIYQRSCDVELGSTKCGVNVEHPAYLQLANVTDIINPSTIIVAGPGSYAEGWFDRGSLTFNSGANSGFSFPIRTHRYQGGGYAISTWVPITFDVAILDGVKLVAGCDKRLATCATKFSNAVNFRGCPHMPGNDFVMQYPNQEDEGLDGTTRFDKY